MTFDPTVTAVAAKGYIVYYKTKEDGVHWVVEGRSSIYFKYRKAIPTRVILGKEQECEDRVQEYIRHGTVDAPHLEKIKTQEDLQKRYLNGAYPRRLIPKEKKRFYVTRFVYREAEMLAKQATSVEACLCAALFKTNNADLKHLIEEHFPLLTQELGWVKEECELELTERIASGRE